jgi:hypothetical protein
MGGCLFAVLVALPAAMAADPGPLAIGGALGPAYLAKSRSNTLSHLFKPLLRLDLRAELAPRLEAGAGVVAQLASSEHYRVLGGLGLARFAVVRSARFSLGGSAGLGLGHDADILHGDLSADGRIAPYWLVGIDGRWALGERWRVGVEVGWQNAALLHLGLVVGRRLGGGAR